MRNQLVPNSRVVDIKGRYISRVRDPTPIPDHLGQGFSARKISPCNFWLKKPVGVGSAKETAGFSGLSS